MSEEPSRESESEKRKPGNGERKLNAAECCFAGFLMLSKNINAKCVIDHNYIVRK